MENYNYKGVKDCFGYYLNHKECEECDTKVTCHIVTVDDEDEDCDQPVSGQWYTKS